MFPLSNIQVIYFFAELAQSVERKTFNLVAVGSNPTFGKVKTFKLNANMPERSKGDDLRSSVFVRVGSNPTVGKVKTFILTTIVPEWSKGADLRSAA